MGYVFLALALLGLFTSTAFTGIVLVAIPGYLRERRRSAAREAEMPGFTPSITLCKPLHGAEPGLEAHLETFFRLDYPRYEILFCARSESDPGMEVARHVAARHPRIPVQFLATGGQPNYINDKVISMERMEAAAAHSILVISDSDVRVAPDYLRAVSLPFDDERVGAVTCLYRGVAAQGGLWARLEAVGMSVEMTAGVLAARMVEGMHFTLGPTMAFRRDTIRRIGGFKVTADYCADDFILGNETAKLGQKVVLSHHVIDHLVINTSLLASFRHQVRWMKSTRFSRPKGHFGTALSFSVAFGLLGAVGATILGHPGWGIALLGWSLATREALALFVGCTVVRDRNLLSLLFLYPVRDLLGFCFWLASYGSRSILWRDKVFQLLPGGKMREAMRS
jgi:ceramide glucosyltransferase